MKPEMFSARASLPSYLVLSGVYFVMAGLFAWLAVFRPGSSAWKGSLISAVAGALWIVWLRGFRLGVDNGILVYRDGLYRTQMGEVARITAVRGMWVKWTCLPRMMSVPRLVVDFEDRQSISINPKVFSRASLVVLRQKVSAGRTRIPAAS
jgi:hypothetical protein